MSSCGGRFTLEELEQCKQEKINLQRWCIFAFIHPPYCCAGQFRFTCVAWHFCIDWNTDFGAIWCWRFRRSAPYYYLQGRAIIQHRMHNTSVFRGAQYSSSWYIIVCSANERITIILPKRIFQYYRHWSKLPYRYWCIVHRTALVRIPRVDP